MIALVVIFVLISLLVISIFWYRWQDEKACFYCVRWLNEFHLKRVYMLSYSVLSTFMTKTHSVDSLFIFILTTNFPSFGSPGIQENVMDFITFRCSNLSGKIQRKNLFGIHIYHQSPDNIIQFFYFTFIFCLLKNKTQFRIKKIFTYWQLSSLQYIFLSWVSSMYLPSFC